MNKGLHKKDGHQEDIFSINADQGWQNMAFLLDAEMPVKKKRQLWPGVLKTMMAACLLLGVLKTTDNNFKTDKQATDDAVITSTAVLQHNPLAPAAAVAPVSVPIQNAIQTGFNPATTSNSNITVINKTSPASQLFQSINGNPNLLPVAANSSMEVAGHTFGAGAEMAKTGFLDGPEAAVINPQILEKENGKVMADAMQATGTAAPNDTAKSPAGQKKPTKQLRSKAVDLYAGAQLQQGFQSGNSFTAAPYAQAQLNLGKKLYASLGLGIYTGNGGAKAEEISEEMVNDVANNIKNYSTTTRHTKLRYMDVPLSVGLKIGTHLSVEAGLQTSFLINSKVTREKVAYDFRMTNLGYVPPLTIQAPMAVIVKPESTPRTVDFRYLAGVRYDMGRITAKLQYQQGFKPVMSPASDNEVHSTKAQAVNLQLLFKL